jgi:hypothetical protein
MPARSVVFSGIRKHDGRSFRDLLPGKYHYLRCDDMFPFTDGLCQVNTHKCLEELDDVVWMIQVL